MSKRQIPLSVVAASAILAASVACDRAPRPAVDRSHYVETALSRPQQVEKCGSCHAQAFENWKKGPHANSYKMLRAHDAYIDSSNNFPPSYNAFVEANMEPICASCHTGQNIFETNFDGVDHQAPVNLIAREKFPRSIEQAYTRDLKSEPDTATGVDCLTCHVLGERVVTNADSKVSDDSGLLKSKLFSDNASCFSCHHHQVSTMKELVAAKALDQEKSCVQCHQEYDADGKGTHYLYWRNDPKDKKRPARLQIFESVGLEETAVGGRPSLKVSWTNTGTPHGYSECGEARSVVTALLKNGKTKVLAELLLNRKNFFDAIEKMPPHFKAGQNGDEFVYMHGREPVVAAVDPRQVDRVLLTGWVKPQYWSHEKEFVQVYERRIEITATGARSRRASPMGAADAGAPMSEPN
jgi:hypothetical protein